MFFYSRAHPKNHTNLVSESSNIGFAKQHHKLQLLFVQCLVWVEFQDSTAKVGTRGAFTCQVYSQEMLNETWTQHSDSQVHVLPITVCKRPYPFLGVIFSACIVRINCASPWRVAVRLRGNHEYLFSKYLESFYYVSGMILDTSHRCKQNGQNPDRGRLILGKCSQ